MLVSYKIINSFIKKDLLFYLVDYNRLKALLTAQKAHREKILKIVFRQILMFLF